MGLRELLEQMDLMVKQDHKVKLVYREAKEKKETLEQQELKVLKDFREKLVPKEYKV